MFVCSVKVPPGSDLDGFVASQSKNVRTVQHAATPLGVPSSLSMLCFMNSVTKEANKPGTVAHMSTANLSKAATRTIDPCC